MNKHVLALNSKLDEIINLQSPYDDEPEGNMLRNAAYGVGGAAVAGAGYGAARQFGPESVKSAIRTGEGYAKQGYGMAKEYGGRAMNYAGNVGTAVKGATQGLDMLGSQAGKAATGWGKFKAALAAARKVRFASRSRMVELNSKLDRLIKFESPLSEFRKAGGLIEDEYLEKYKAAKEAKKQAARNLSDAQLGAVPEYEPIRAKLHRESYVVPGAAGAGLAGMGLGAGLMLGSNRLRGFGGRLLSGATGAMTGGIIGAGIGSEIGGRIRRKETAQ